jgi:hypothetical protein
MRADEPEPEVADGLDFVASDHSELFLFGGVSMNKVLLALSIMILSGSLPAQGGWLFDGYPMDGKQSRWLARALRPRALWHESKRPETNGQKSNQIEPYPFGDGVPREPVRPPTEDDLLLHREIDGF